MKSITCMCEHQFEADIPEVVDLEKQPGTLQEIISGSFMNVTCPSCRKVLKPEFPFRIFNHQDGWEINFFPELERQAKMKNPPAVSGNKNIRLVIGYAELIEKIRMFHEKLDDRVVEYLKYFILSKVLEKTESEEKDLDVYYNERKGNDLEFHIHGLKSDEMAIFKVPFSTYEKALANIDQHAGEEPFKEFLTPPYVSLNKLYSWDDV
jgi:hypothetical protein